MEIDKGTILNLLRERGEDDKAKQAEEELPERVDTEKDRGLLEGLGINPSEIAGKLGGGDIPGL